LPTESLAFGGAVPAFPQPSGLAQFAAPAQVWKWHIASIRGGAALWSLSERSGHRSLGRPDRL